MAEKQKILLIYPPAPVMNREDRCQQPVDDLLVIPPLPPTDLMYLAAVAENVVKIGKQEEKIPIATISNEEINDYEESVENIEAVDEQIPKEDEIKEIKNKKKFKKVEAEPESTYFEAKIVDYSLKDEKDLQNPTDKFKNDLKNYKPDYIVLNAASTTLSSDLAALTIAKEILPNAITIVKGAHFLTENTDILYKYKSVDLVIVGEAEETFKEILEGKSYNKIKGLCYRDGFVAKYTGKRPFIQDLDKLPFPARHLVNNSLYKRPDNNKVQAIIKVARGCPHHCFFCLATPVSGSKVRVRSVENIIEEIKECVNTYGIKNFIFWSDIFNMDREWVLDLCEAIMDANLKITWSANTRADTADEEMAEFMYDAGCRLVSIGVESGSQFVLDKIGKKITIDDVRETVKIFKRNKIKIYNYFVLGLPWDDEDTIEQTIDFAVELDSDYVSFYTATPLPGTRFYKFAQENNLFDKNISFEHAYYSPVIKTMCLTKERILELHKLAIKRFYLRPMFILRTLVNIRSLTEIKNYFKVGMQILMRR